MSGNSRETKKIKLRQIYKEEQENPRGKASYDEQTQQEEGEN